jgi:AAA domain/UvrD-like helicase C-terminal domain
MKEPTENWSIMHHLNVRVAWHDSKWDGTICRNPIGNSFCVDLDRIRAERIDVTEQELAGKRLADLPPSQHPPCIAESGAFMNKIAWSREFNHPYQGLPKTKDSHGQLKRTSITVEPYTTFVVPFLWMLREQQERIESGLPTPLPPDDESPFNSSWVFGRHRQEALCDLFFGRLTPGRSLIFFYTKAGQPVDETASRLVVGVGTIASISGLLRYESATKVTYPMWDRKIQHSIRPDDADGFLLPYHDYLEPTGDESEDARRLLLLKEIAVVPEQSQMASFSFAGELSTSDVALSTLVKCLNAVRKIREHGIAAGPWERREEWLNAQIAEIWRDRGAFPGAGAALEALGLRLGTSLMLELIAKTAIGPTDDPWPILDQILRGTHLPPSPAYAQDIKAVTSIWAGLTEVRRDLLKLLSRFDLSSAQALRWFDPQKRVRATRANVDDAAILENPYRIVELDLGDWDDHPVSLGTIDRGLLPDATVAAKHPVPEPSAITSLLDRRRVRAVYVAVLRAATQNGDSLLSEFEAGELIAKLDLSHPCLVPHDWLMAELPYVEQEVARVPVLKEASTGETIPCLQLLDVKAREDKLGRILGKRAESALPPLNEKWQSLLASAIEDGGGKVNFEDPRHKLALDEQADALAKITSRKLSVLIGRAGTGKTTVLGALMKAQSLRKDGLLFLAPTGKARVRLAQKAGADAMTVAQFLYSLGRYDGSRQRPLFEGREQYRKEKTVIIDESSMLTLDDLFATLMALDLAHVQRIILVGDPNQLPPIGVGRPFADFVSHLEDASTARSASMAKLTVELRTRAGSPSDLLKLASWYTREIQPVDADRVLSDLDLGNSFNDLTIRHWTDAQTLHHVMGEELTNRFQLTSLDDITSFNREVLGLTPEGWTPFEDHDGPDNFQVLSPVRLHPYGVHDLNRWFQRTFRSKQVASPRGVKLGEEEIVWGDKVILVRNGQRDGFDFANKTKTKDYLANGEIGVANSAKTNCLNVAFTGRPGVRFGFFPSQFSPDGSPLELAYTITVHKAQGSEFGVVFLVLPKHTRLLSRELLYTALTRARQHLVLLIEGSDSSGLYDLTRPERSETARRNTNLFAGAVREHASDVPYATHLVHRARNGEMVRSKSELVIANHLVGASIPYTYERPLDGTFTVGRLRPDFSFITDAGDVIVWEHLGMLSRDDYRRGWEWKKAWYESNGYRLGETLFITEDDDRGGLDSLEIERTASQIAALLA